MTEPQLPKEIIELYDMQLKQDASKLVFPYQKDYPRADDATLRHVHALLHKDDGKALKKIKTIGIAGCELSDEGVALLGEIIVHAPNLETVNFKYNQFTPEQTALIAESLEGHKNLKQLVFSYENLDSPKGELLGKVLQAVPNVELLSLSNCVLRNSSCNVLAEHLQQSKVNSLIIDAPRVWPAGMETLVEGVEKSPQIASFAISEYTPEETAGKLPLLIRAASIPHLRRVEVLNNGLEASEVHKVAQAIGKNTALDAVFLSEKEIPNDQMAQAAQKMLRTNPSIKLVSIKGKEHTGVSEQTMSKLKSTVRDIPDFNCLYMGETRFGVHYSFDHDDISRTITQKDNPTAAFKKLSFKQLKLLTQHPKSIFLMSRSFVGPMLRAEKAFPAFLEKLPGIPDAPEDWLKPNSTGFAPVDNPLLWDTPEKAKAILASMPLTADKLLETSPKGTSITDAALDALRGEEFVKALNDKGIKLGAKELLDSDGKPNELSNKLSYRTQGMRAVFIDSNWIGKNPREMREVFKAMPEYCHKYIPLHSLEQRMRRHSPAQSGLGR